MPTFEELMREMHSISDIDTKDFTDEQHEIFKAYIAEIEELTKDKIDGFCRYILEEKAKAEYLSAESKRLGERARAVNAKIKNLKEWYLHTMALHKETKVSGNVHTVSARKTKSLVVSVPVELLEDRFVKVEKTPIKTAIRAAIEDGEDVNGCFFKEDTYLAVK